MIRTARAPVLSLAALAWTCMSPPAPRAAPQAAAGAAQVPAAAGAAQVPAAAAPVPVKAVSLSEEPSHRYLIDNAYIDMANLVLEPKSATRLHHHRHDLVTVTVGAGQISDEVAGKPPVVVKLRDGQVRFTEAGMSHVVRNLGSAPFREITIELRHDDAAHKATEPKWEEASGTKTSRGARREILFVKDGARVSSLTLPPGAAEPPRDNPTAELLVALTDLDVGSGDASAKLKAGEVQWRGGRYTGRLSNNGKQPVKLVLLEFK